jgi:hypothetical protein
VGFTLSIKHDLRKKNKKKRKKLRNRGFLKEILKIGAVGDSKKVDFIGLMRF